MLKLFCWSFTPFWDTTNIIKLLHKSRNGTFIWLSPPMWQLLVRALSTIRHVGMQVLFLLILNWSMTQTSRQNKFFRQWEKYPVSTEANLKLFEASHFIEPSCGIFKMDLSLLLMVLIENNSKTFENLIYLFWFQIFSVECAYLVTVFQFENISNN